MASVATARPGWAAATAVVGAIPGVTTVTSPGISSKALHVLQTPFDEWAQPTIRLPSGMPAVGIGP
jgi:hypothetical protein